jgi:hypothetical protein
VPAAVPKVWQWLGELIDTRANVKYDELGEFIDELAANLAALSDTGEDGCCCESTVGKGEGGREEQAVGLGTETHKTYFRLRWFSIYLIQVGAGSPSA